MNNTHEYIFDHNELEIYNRLPYHMIIAFLITVMINILIIYRMCFLKCFLLMFFLIPGGLFLLFVGIVTALTD